MKTIMLMLFVFLPALVNAEIWKKPPYQADEGHIKNEMERQEEQIKENDNRSKKHQDTPREEDPDVKMMDEDVKEDEDPSL